MCTIIKKPQLVSNPLPLPLLLLLPDVHVFFAFSALCQKMAAETESKSKAKEQFLPLISLLIIINTKKDSSWPLNEY